jgi:hypothetical protein
MPCDPDHSSPWIVGDDGVGFFGGLVGDALQELALTAGFRFNAIVINPPSATDAYNGSWDRWADDWLNRADLIAVWFYRTAPRTARGFQFPEPFYDVRRSPTESNVTPACCEPVASSPHLTRVLVCSTCEPVASSPQLTRVLDL